MKPSGKWTTEYNVTIDGHQYVASCADYQSFGQFYIIADDQFVIADSFGYCNPEDAIYKHSEAHGSDVAAKESFINARMREAVEHEIEVHIEWSLTQPMEKQ